MLTHYKFKRAYYYKILDAFKERNIIYLLGPRKCGKTVCMKQIADNLDNAIYYDVKTHDEDDSVDFIDNVIESIKQNKEFIYLIDEVTYLTFPMGQIAQLAAALSAFDNTTTHIVITGSQPTALKTWAHIAGFSQFIYFDFISYPEWLSFKGMTEVSAETYYQFITSTREFYNDFKTLDEYLQMCLDETIIVDNKINNNIIHNKCDKLTVEILKDVLYSVVVTQKDSPSIINFFGESSLIRIIRSFLKTCYREIDKEEVHNRIEAILLNRIEGYKALDAKVLRQALLFLYNCGLITLTYISDSNKPGNVIDVIADLKCSYEFKLRMKEEIIDKVNIYIKHPMFYAEILKEIFSNVKDFKIDSAIIGEIAKCHARGILPQDGCYKYRNVDTTVDYINKYTATAVETTISNEDFKNVYLGILPAGYEKFLLTKDIEDSIDGIKRIPYYKFIYNNSIQCPANKSKEDTNNQTSFFS